MVGQPEPEAERGKTAAPCCPCTGSDPEQEQPRRPSLRAVQRETQILAGEGSTAAFLPEIFTHMREREDHKEPSSTSSRIHSNPGRRQHTSDAPFHDLGPQAPCWAGVRSPEYLRYPEPAPVKGDRTHPQHWRQGPRVDTPYENGLRCVRRCSGGHGGGLSSPSAKPLPRPHSGPPGLSPGQATLMSPSEDSCTGWTESPQHWPTVVSLQQHVNGASATGALVRTLPGNPHFRCSPRVPPNSAATQLFKPHLAGFPPVVTGVRGCWSHRPCPSWCRAGSCATAHMETRRQNLPRTRKDAPWAPRAPRPTDPRAGSAWAVPVLTLTTREAHRVSHHHLGAALRDPQQQKRQPQKTGPGGVTLASLAPNRKLTSTACKPGS